MRCSRILEYLDLDCSDWKACVASETWVGLPVPSPEVIADGDHSVLTSMLYVLNGGKYYAPSCRVMVVGPQMVGARVLAGFYMLTAVAGWQDKPHQRTQKMRQCRRVHLG